MRCGENVSELSQIFMVIVRAQPWSSGKDHIVTKQDSYLRQLSTVC